MHSCAKTITNTARLIYQYTVDPSLAPRQYTTMASVSNMIIAPSECSQFPLFKSGKNNICFSHGESRKIHCIKQHIKTHHYEILPHKDYNIIEISATMRTFIEYTTNQHMCPHTIKFTTPVVVTFIIPKCIHHNILNLTSRILEISPPTVTPHHITFNTVMHFNIDYKED